MRTIHPYELGGTLFVPAIHKHLDLIVRGKKFPQLRSLVIDTEDGILEADLDRALLNIQNLLADFTPTKLLCFLRPRNQEILKLLLSYEGIKKMDGFILPKFGLENSHNYLNLLGNTPFHFMPSIEGSELFNPAELKILRDILLPYHSQIPLIRFGAEDMLRQLGLRRECQHSLFDMSAPSYVIGSLLAIFKPYGFHISGGVYRCYKDHEGFKHDVLRDLQEGLISKTIIHPDQIDLVDECYRVTESEFAAASQLSASQTAVFSLDDTMAEKLTQYPWSQIVLIRESLYGKVPS